MNNYSISLLLVFSMIFFLLFLSVKKVKALSRDLNAPYNYMYYTNIEFEGETLAQKMAKKAASDELKCNEYTGTKSNSRYCQYLGLYGGYGGLGGYGGYGGYGGTYISYSGYGVYGGLY